jgi:hypothetical protein
VMTIKRKRPEDAANPNHIQMRIVRLKNFSLCSYPWPKVFPTEGWDYSPGQCSPEQRFINRDYAASSALSVQNLVFGATFPRFFASKQIFSLWHPS